MQQSGLPLQKWRVIPMTFCSIKISLSRRDCSVFGVQLQSFNVTHFWFTLVHYNIWYTLLSFENDLAYTLKFSVWKLKGDVPTVHSSCFVMHLQGSHRTGLWKVNWFWLVMSKLLQRLISICRNILQPVIRTQQLKYLIKTVGEHKGNRFKGLLILVGNTDFPLIVFCSKHCWQVRNT